MHETSNWERARIGELQETWLPLGISRLPRPLEVENLVTATPSVVRIAPQAPWGEEGKKPTETALFEENDRILRLLGGPPQKAILT